MCTFKDCFYVGDVLLQEDLKQKLKHYDAADRYPKVGYEEKHKEI